jgi:low temperature requirement protein LtrA
VSDAGQQGFLPRFRRVFWLPPRAHGQAIEDRTVTSLELFSDLVYVVVIGRASAALADDVSGRRVGTFAIVFTLIWLAWLNGAVYHDLHGRGDGRTRVAVFTQMLLLALLAVFTAGAGGDSGRAFAIVYAIDMGLLAWLWHAVRRQDEPEYGRLTGRYLVGMLVTVVVVAASAFLPPDARLAVWAAVGVGWVVGGIVLDRTLEVGRSGIAASASLVERFALFVIIVLGEVVVGVVAGMSAAPHDALPVATGLVGLTIAFAIWWTYFDFVGRRLPRNVPGPRARWLYGHLPITMGITASGAAMVSLTVHADDARAPAPTSWLLGGSVALALLAMLAVMSSLEDRRRFPTIYDPVIRSLAVAAVVIVGIGWWAPPPLALPAAIAVLLAAVWLLAVAAWLRLDDPDAALPPGV